MVEIEVERSKGTIEESDLSEYQRECMFYFRQRCGMKDDMPVSTVLDAMCYCALMYLHREEWNENV